MNRRWRQRAATLGRLVVWATTAWLLVATSAPYGVGYCGKWTAPVTFKATGTCGPGGLIVLDTAGSEILIFNAAAVGLPPLDRRTTTTQGPRVRDTSGNCPRVYERGGWAVEFPACPAVSDGGVSIGDAGSTLFDGGDGGGAPPGSDGGTPANRDLLCGTSRCQAVQGVGGELSFTCTGPLGDVLCQSRLTRVP